MGEIFSHRGDKESVANTLAVIKNKRIADTKNFRSRVGTLGGEVAESAKKNLFC